MRAKKSFGQHFLVEESIAKHLADSIDPAGAEVIIEVGPGKGILTKYLIRQPLPVYAIELDRDLVPLLKREFADTDLRLVNADILRLNFGEVIGPETPFILVGNYPYNISSQIVFLGLQHRHHMPFMAGMFQKEMADRIISPPGSKNFGVISAITQAYYTPSFLFNVKPGSFVPPPRVNSAVIALKRYRTEIEGVPFNTLRRVVKMAFSQRRKKLRNTLTEIIPEDVLKDMAISDQRPEQLQVEQFISLARYVANAQPT